MISGSNTIKRAKSVTTDELPSCQSENATSTLREAFNQSQVARAENLSAIEIQNTTEIQPSTKERRNCAATIMLNNTNKIGVAFVLEKRTSGKYMLTFELRDTEDGSGVSKSPTQSGAAPSSRHEANRPAGQASTAPIQSATAIAAEWDHDANIVAGVKAFIASYKAGGMVDAAATVDDCYKAIDKQGGNDAQLRRLEYCAAMDLAAYNFDDAMAKSKGFPMTEYFTIDNVSIRVSRINKYISEPDSAKYITGAWTTSAINALNKHANN